MKIDRHLWQIWARNLHHWGMQDIAATLLDAAGPLNMLVAQLIYLGQPILCFVMSREQLGAFASMLEDAVETKAFTTYLREGAIQ